MLPINTDIAYDGGSMGAIKKASSRVARIQAEQERRLIIKITLLSVVGVVMLVVLAVWGVQAFIGISNFWLNSKVNDTETQTNTSNDVVRVPSLGGFTDEVTNKDNVDVTAYASEGQSLVLERNGTQVGENVADSGGTAVFGKVSIAEGKNEFRAYLVSKDGKRSDSSSPITITRDSQPPTIGVDKPFSGETFRGASQQVIEVSGKASGAEYVFVQDTRVVLGADGNFNQRIRLTAGENSVVVYAVDDAGNESVKDTRVIRWEE